MKKLFFCYSISIFLFTQNVFSVPEHTFCELYKNPNLLHIVLNFLPFIDFHKIKVSNKYFYDYIENNVEMNMSIEKLHINKYRCFEIDRLRFKMFIAKRHDLPSILDIIGDNGAYHYIDLIYTTINNIQFKTTLLENMISSQKELQVLHRNALMYKKFFSTFLGGISEYPSRKYRLFLFHAGIYSNIRNRLYFYFYDLNFIFYYFGIPSYTEEISEFAISINYLNQAVLAKHPRAIAMNNALRKISITTIIHYIRENLIIIRNHHSQKNMATFIRGYRKLMQHCFKTLEKQYQGVRQHFLNRIRELRERRAIQIQQAFERHFLIINLDERFDLYFRELQVKKLEREKNAITIQTLARAYLFRTRLERRRQQRREQAVIQIQQTFRRHLFRTHLEQGFQRRRTLRELSTTRLRSALNRPPNFGCYPIFSNKVYPR